VHHHHVRVFFGIGLDLFAWSCSHIVLESLITGNLQVILADLQHRHQGMFELILLHFFELSAVSPKLDVQMTSRDTR
jgi:hypothetical protein